MGQSLTRIFAQVAMLCPFGLAALGVVVAVFGKAARKFPFQPSETRVFTKPTLPRWYSKIYVVDARCVARNKRL
jgi:hypothetical protein